MALPLRVCLATSIPGPRGTTGSVGVDGLDGISASTTLNMLAGYVMPTQQTSSAATVVDSSVFAMGQIIFMQVAGHMRVDGIPDGTSLTLFNLRDDSLGAYPDNATALVVTIPNGAKIVPAGPQGPVGIISALGAGGDLMGSYPNPTLIPTGTPGVYGDSTNVAQITTDAEGRVVSAIDVPIAFPPGGAPGGPTGPPGDLVGFYPNPTLAASGVVAGSYGTSVAWPIVTIDAKGRITAASVAAPTFLSRSGLLGSATINFNTANDQLITLSSMRCRITSIIAEGNSYSPFIESTCAIYTHTGGSGNVVVAPGQSWNTLFTSIDWKEFTLANYALVALVVSGALYLRLAGPFVGAPTCRLWVFGEKYD